MAVVENGCRLLGLGTLKSAVYHESMKWVDFLYADTNIGKLKVYYLVDMVKNGRGLINHGTLKPGVSHK